MVSSFVAYMVSTVLPAGVAEAAVEDGRPYQLFLAELLRLGLDQHLQRRARNSQPLT
jgi:hypothetical protein